MITILATWYNFLFYTGNWPRRWNCGQWSAALGYISIISEVLIWAAYWFVGFLIVYFLIKQKDRFLRAMSTIFAIFFFLCGITHLCEAIIFYYPFYRFLALVLAVTAIFSWFGILIMLPLLKKLLKIPDQLIATKLMTMRFEETKHTYEVAAEILDAGVFNWNLKTDDLAPSPQLCKLLHILDADSINKSNDLFKYIHVEERSRLLKTFRDRLYTTTVQTTRIRLVDQTNHIHTCALNWKVMYDDHHLPIEIIGAILAVD